MPVNLDYSEIVKQAEAAVASIKDSELKGIAFGKILDTLLGQQDQPKRQVSSKQQTRSQKAGLPRAKKRSGPKGYVEELIDEGFFKAPKTLAGTKAELIGNLFDRLPAETIGFAVFVGCQPQ